MDARTLSGGRCRRFSSSYSTRSSRRGSRSVANTSGHDSQCLIKFGCCWTVVQIGDDNRLLVSGFFDRSVDSLCTLCRCLRTVRSFEHLLFVGSHSSYFSYSRSKLFLEIFISARKMRKDKVSAIQKTTVPVNPSTCDTLVFYKYSSNWSIEIEEYLVPFDDT